MHFRRQQFFENQDGGSFNFRLNNHHEKLIPSLYFSIKNVTFIGGSWRLRVVYCRGSNLMLKRFFYKKSANSDFYGTKFGGLLHRRPTYSEKHVYHFEHDFWPIKRANRTKIATCGLTEETEKRKEKRQEQKVTKPLYFTTTWRRLIANDMHQIWWVSYFHLTHISLSFTVISFTPIFMLFDL